jgi:hypothetical protein
MFLTGLVILLSPDSGKPLIEFNSIHGPSLPDLIGLTFMFISWMISCVVLVINWGTIKIRIGTSGIIFLLTFYLISIGVIIISLKLSSDWTLWPGIIIASLINLIFIAIGFSSKKEERI